MTDKPKATPLPSIEDEPGMAERFQRALRKGAQHAAEAPISADAEAERKGRHQRGAFTRERREAKSGIEPGIR
jgi:hypothetical protein